MVFKNGICNRYSALILVAVFIGVLVSAATTKPRGNPIENAIHGIVIINDDHGGSGTGTIVGENYILTNSHVIHEYGSTFTITTREGNIYPVFIIFDNTVKDLAAIKVPDWEKVKKENHINILKFAPDYHVSDVVYSIGHPEGVPFIVAKGIIGNAYVSLLGGNYGIMSNAGIFRGNSGGPLVNENGEIVGINELLKSMEGGSYGGTIPEDIVQKVMDDEKRFKENHVPRFGIIVNKSGSISGFEPKSPAQLSGIRLGDFVYSYTKNGSEVIFLDNNHRIQYVRSLFDGEHAFVTVRRDGEYLDFDIIPTIMKVDNADAIQNNRPGRR